MKRHARPRLKRKAKPGPPPAPPQDDHIRFFCSCGAPLKIAIAQINGHGKCPRCKHRLLLRGKVDSRGKTFVLPFVLEDDKSSGQTFMIEPIYRIEEHFREIKAPPDKLGFDCICGSRIFASSAMVGKRGKCPKCGARLLLR